MQSHYKTEQGEQIKVLQFDGVNRMAYCDFGNGELRWAGEPEYSKWEPLYQYIPDIPAQMIDNPKIEDNAIQIGEPTEIPLDAPSEDSGEVVEGIPEPKKLTEESNQIEGKEEVKPKRKYTKKSNNATDTK